MLVADGEPAAECFGCATSREQASIVYKQMKELVQASPHLTQMLEVVESRKTIACAPTNSFWRVISSDAGRQEGLNIHSLCYDEIHQAKDRKLWGAVRYGGISRAQSLILAITTAGTDRASVCYELHEHALKCMVDPNFDPQFFAFVAGATIDDDYRDPTVWRAANPSFGVTMDEESFKADVLDAEGSKARLADFLRYRLNVWVQGSNKFVDLTRWERCKRGYEPPAPSRVWHCGLDLAQTWDVNAFVAVSKTIDEENGDEVFDVICRFWIPEDNAAQRREEVPYVLWARDAARSGLTLTPGDTCDYDFIKRDILAFAKTHQVAKIATDPHNAHHLQQQLQAEGLNVLGFSQTFQSLNGPTKLMDTLIAQGRLRTSDNPILNSHASNCVVRTNSEGYIKIQKPSPMSPARVDGMVALSMALALASDADAGTKMPDPEIIVL
jgi:phage terminase large subunit-like protein